MLSRTGEVAPCYLKLNKRHGVESALKVAGSRSSSRRRRVTTAVQWRSVRKSSSATASINRLQRMCCTHCLCYFGGFVIVSFALPPLQIDPIELNPTSTTLSLDVYHIVPEFLRSVVAVLLFSYSSFVMDSSVLSPSPRERTVGWVTDIAQRVGVRARCCTGCSQRFGVPLSSAHCAI